MKTCDRIQAQIELYLDDELRGREQARMEAHLRECDTCRRALADQRSFLQSVREASPLYLAPPALRTGVEQALRNAPPAPAAPAKLRTSIQGFLRTGSGFARPSFSPRVLIFAACILLVFLAGAWYGLDSRLLSLPQAHSDFALMAADAHTRYARGQLPLEISSASPEEITTWFAGKVPFGLKLPNYQEASGQERIYQLDGARLIGFRNDYAAYVAYRMRHRPISLIATSESVAGPWGGEEIVSKGLRFYCDTVNSLKVITWSHRGLTYALVSDLEERGQQSCIVCHMGTRDRDFIEDLKPAARSGVMRF